jgi:hypothetical protein
MVQFIAPWSVLFIWAMRLVFQSLKRCDALLGLLTGEISPLIGLPYPKPIPQLKEVLDLTNTVRNRIS